ncbi:MAG: GntR family transcriptional regulator [Rhodobacteraceae bacterium]|nr:GntR family transcriptional regulator [Paracoccaceae bacterium]
MFLTLQTTNLVQEIAQQIGDAIAKGQLKPGDRITELRLAKEFGTSRAPVREAARLLESQGLVVSSPRRGFFVRTLSECDLDDMFELRMALELHAAELAVERITDEEISQLKAQLAKLHALATHESINDQIIEDYEFHRMLCSFSGNKRLLKVYDEISLDMRAGITLIGKLYDDPERIAETHEPIVEAVEKRDAPLLRAALQHHIGVAKQYVVKLFEKRT